MICFLQTHSFSLCKVWIDGLEWCGLLVNYCDVIISCLDSHSDGTHSLQRKQLEYLLIFKYQNNHTIINTCNFIYAVHAKVFIACMNWHLAKLNIKVSYIYKLLLTNKNRKKTITKRKGAGREMYPFHDFKTLNNCHLLLSGIDRSNQNDQSMTKCTRLMIQTHAWRQYDAHLRWPSLRVYSHLSSSTVRCNNICHWGLVNGLLQFRDSWWTQMASCETLMRARPVTEGLMASLLESSSLHFPGIWRANPSRVLPINPAPHLLLQTRRERSVFALRPHHKHTELHETGLVGIPHQEHGSQLNLHIRLIVCCHWPLNTTYMSNTSALLKETDPCEQCRMLPLANVVDNYIICLLQTSSPVIS